jgi:hypothetical protein
VAVYYEGTPRDDEYAFGLRVLKSLRRAQTPHDIVVLVRPSVRPSALRHTKHALIRPDSTIAHLPIPRHGSADAKPSTLEERSRLRRC